MRAARPLHAGAAVAALLAAACAGAGPRQPAPASAATALDSTSAAPAPVAPAGTSPAEFEAVYRARMDSSRARFTAADARFMEGMIHHHAQALVMAGWAASHGAGPAVRTLAARIINAQKDEIATMQQWLRERGQPVPEVHEMDGMVMIHGGAMGDMDMQMPGMLTPEQLRQLDAARGPAFDRLFLTYMIQHHRGAVTMVHDLFATPGAAQDEQAFKLASDVQVDQTTEIARMQRMLSQYGPPGADR